MPHFTEAFLDGSLLALFMLSACLCVAAIQHPRSPIRARVANAAVRRGLIGVAMGLTAIGLIYSPIGQRSGAHMNPATTLAFTVLGKLRPIDAVSYIAAQFIGGLAGIGAARLLLGRVVTHDSVSWVATVPGKPGGSGARRAWAAECAMAFGLFFMVLLTSNWSVTAGYTGIIAGLFVAVYITIFAPISGMSINPARSLASLLPARRMGVMWIYASAPVVGMLLAAGTYGAVRGAERVYCAKLRHGDGTCHFNCRYAEMPGIVLRPKGGGDIQPSP